MLSSKLPILDIIYTQICQTLSFSKRKKGLRYNSKCECSIISFSKAGMLPDSR